MALGRAGGRDGACSSHYSSHFVSHWPWGGGGVWTPTLQGVRFCCYRCHLPPAATYPLRPRLRPAEDAVGSAAGAAGHRRPYPPAERASIVSLLAGAAWWPPGRPSRQASGKRPACQSVSQAPGVQSMSGVQAPGSDGRPRRDRPRRRAPRSPGDMGASVPLQPKLPVHEVTRPATTSLTAT